MDACRREIGQRAAQIIAARNQTADLGPEVVELFPTLQPGDTIRQF
jgi:LacI family gluconate utilization system Gnt-I transcriptional repressor